MKLNKPQIKFIKRNLINYEHDLVSFFPTQTKFESHSNPISLHDSFSFFLFSLIIEL